MAGIHYDRYITIEHGLDLMMSDCPLVLTVNGSKIQKVHSLKFFAASSGEELHVPHQSPLPYAFTQSHVITAAAMVSQNRAL